MTIGEEDEKEGGVERAEVSKGKTNITHLIMTSWTHFPRLPTNEITSKNGQTEARTLSWDDIYLVMGCFAPLMTYDWLLPCKY